MNRRIEMNKVIVTRENLPHISQLTAKIDFLYMILEDIPKSNLSFAINVPKFFFETYGTRITFNHAEKQEWALKFSRELIKLSKELEQYGLKHDNVVSFR